MLVGDKSGGLKPQDDHSKTESGNRESQRQLQDNVFVPNILKSDQIGLFTSSGIKDARSILISMERSDIKTGSVPLSCIFQRSRINVHQVAGSFLFTKMVLPDSHNFIEKNIDVLTKSKAKNYLIKKSSKQKSNDRSTMI